MLRSMLSAAALVVASLSVNVSAADAPPPKYTTTETSIGPLLDDPAAKAVLQKHIPELVGNAQIEMARAMTLKQVQGYAGDMLSDAALKKIDDELSKLPAK